MITLLGSYVHPEERTVWSGGLVKLLAELGFSAGAARAALVRLTRRDLLERVRDGRLVQLPANSPHDHDHDREAAALLEELGLARYAAVLIGRPQAGAISPLS